MQNELIRKSKQIENQYFQYTDENKGKKSKYKIEMRKKPLEESNYQAEYFQKIENNKINKQEEQNNDTNINFVRYVQPPIHKYVIREKILHHRHFLKYDVSNNQLQEYCKESVNSMCQKENDNEKYLRKYDAKYPQYFMETEDDFEEKQAYRKYIIKPASTHLYKPLDEYFIENERAQTIENKYVTKIQRNEERNRKIQRAEVIKNFQELYQNQSKLIEAQNYYIHEQTKLLQARQLMQMGNNNKTLWMETHAQIFENKCYGLREKKEKACQDLINSDGINQSFQQYVTTL